MKPGAGKANGGVWGGGQVHTHLTRTRRALYRRWAWWRCSGSCWRRWTRCSRPAPGGRWAGGWPSARGRWTADPGSRGGAMEGSLLRVLLLVFRRVWAIFGVVGVRPLASQTHHIPGSGGLPWGEFRSRWGPGRRWRGAWADRRRGGGPDRRGGA